MRRVDCKQCGDPVVEEVPWGSGKHHLTKVYMQFLAYWARKLSWKDVAESFQTSGKRSLTRWSTWSSGAWSTAPWGPSSPSA
jgi:hypothetical protein